MKLPPTSWKKTLSALGFRARRGLKERRLRDLRRTEHDQLCLLVLEPRMMLDGDASDGISDNYQDYLPAGFGSGDLVFQDILTGGQEFTEIPDAVSEAVSSTAYSWDSPFDQIFLYSEQGDLTESGTSFRFEQIEVEHDDVTGDPTEFVIALNKYTYTITVGSGSGVGGLGGGLGGGTTGTTGPYGETLDVTRSSWLVKTQDDSGVGQFLVDGSTAAYASQILATSSATWNYSFQKDTSGLWPTIDISMSYEATIDFQWNEALEFDDLYDQGFIGVTDSTTDGEVISESGTLTINGTVATDYQGEIHATESGTGFSYDVSGSYANGTLVNGLPGELEVAVVAAGTFKEGDVVLNAEKDAIVGHDSVGSLFIYDVDSSISQNYSTAYQFDGDGEIVTTTAAENQTADITFDLITDISTFEKSVEVTYTGVDVQHDLVMLSHGSGGQLVSMDGDNAPDDQLIDARKATYTFVLDHDSAWTSQKTELEAEGFNPAPDYYRHTQTDAHSTTAEENNRLTTTFSNYDSYTLTSSTIELFEEKEADDDEFEKQEFVSTQSTTAENETEGVSTSKSITTKLTRTFDVAGTDSLQSAISGTRTTTANYEFLENNSRTNNSNSTSRTGSDMLWLNDASVTEATRALYADARKTVTTTTATEEVANIHRFGNATTVESFNENDSSFTVLVNSSTTVDTTVDEGLNFTDSTTTLNEDSKYKVNGVTIQRVLRDYAETEREDWHGQSVQKTDFNNYLMQFDEISDPEGTEGIGELGDDPSYFTAFEGNVVSGSIVTDNDGNLNLDRSMNRKSAALIISDGHTLDNSEPSDTPVPITSDFSDYAWVNRIAESSDSATVTNHADLLTTRTYVAGEEGYTLDVAGSHSQSQSVDGNRKELENVVILEGDFNDVGLFDGSTDNWNRFDWNANKTVVPVALSEFRSGDLQDEMDQVTTGGYSHFVNYDATTTQFSESSSYSPNWQFDILPLEPETSDQNGGDGSGSTEPEIAPTQLDVALAGSAVRTYDSTSKVTFDDRYSKSIEIKKDDTFDIEMNESVATTIMSERSRVDTGGSNEDQIGRIVNETASADGETVTLETTGSLEVTDENGQTEGGYISLSSMNNQSATNLNTVDIQARGAVAFDYDPALYLDGDSDTDPLVMTTLHGMVHVGEMTLSPGSAGYSESISQSSQTHIDETLVSTSDTASILVGILENSAVATNVTDLVYPQDSSEGGDDGSGGSTDSDGGTDESSNHGAVLWFDDGIGEVAVPELPTGEDENANLESGKITVTKNRDLTHAKQEERLIHVRMDMDQPSRHLHYDARYKVYDQSTETHLHDSVTTEYSPEGADVVATQNDTDQTDRWDIQTEGNFKFKKNSELKSSTFTSRNQGAVRRVSHDSGQQDPNNPDGELTHTNSGSAQILEAVLGKRDRTGNYLVHDGNEVSPVHIPSSRETIEETIAATNLIPVSDLAIFPFFTDSTSIAVPFAAIDYGDESTSQPEIVGFNLVRKTGVDSGWVGALMNFNFGLVGNVIDWATYDNVSTKNITVPFNFNQQSLKTFGYMADEVVNYVGYMSLVDGAEFAATQALYGNLKIFFGTLEVAGGVLLVASGNYVVGGILIAHGFDTALAGVLQVLNGDSTRTFTSRFIAMSYEQNQRFAGVNLDPDEAHFVGEVGDMLIGMVDIGVGVYAASAKLLAKGSRLIGKAKTLNRLQEAHHIVNSADEIIDASRVAGNQIDDAAEQLGKKVSGSKLYEDAAKNKNLKVTGRFEIELLNPPPKGWRYWVTPYRPKFGNRNIVDPTTGNVLSGSDLTTPTHLHELKHFTDSHHEQLYYFARVSKAPGSGIAHFIYETRGYLRSHGYQVLYKPWIPMRSVAHADRAYLVYRDLAGIGIIGTGIVVFWWLSD